MTQEEKMQLAVIESRLPVLDEMLRKVRAEIEEKQAFRDELKAEREQLMDEQIDLLRKFKAENA